MYISDGSTKDYDDEEHKRPCIYSWGWIGDSVPLTLYYITPDIRKALVDQFKQFVDPKSPNYKYVMQHYMGHHTCQICEKQDYYWNGSIRILNEDRIYVCPAGVSHYIEEHRYTPPRQVLKAIKNGIFLTEKEWQDFNKNDEKYQGELTKRHASYTRRMEKERILEERENAEAKKRAQAKLDRINRHMNSGDEFAKAIKKSFLVAWEEKHDR